MLGHRTSQNRPRLEAPQAEQALPPPDFPPELDPPVFPREEVSPQPIADGADGMDVDAGEVGGGPEPMTIDRVDEGSEGEGSEEEEGDAWLNNLILQTQADVWNMFCLKESGCVFPVGEGNSDFFVEEFGGQKVRVDIPESSFDELTGAALDFEQVKQGMKTEVQQLERLKVGRCLVERDGRALAKEKQVTVLTSRWVLTQKTSEIARCRIVVRDFATGGASALNSGIYAPTSSLDGLRCVLAVSVVKDLSLLTADVSVAFMNAPVEAEACDLVLLPANISINGCRVIAWLGKAMNGLRRAPLLWFLELQRVVYSMGGQDTFENTLFRLQTPNGMLLVLVYVDDLLVAAESQQEGEAFLQQLQNIWKIKLTGRILALKRGVLQFLGRTIYRERDGESTLSLGVSEAYMTGIIDSWHEKLKPNETPPKLEEIYKDREKQGEDTPLTAEGEARYRRVLGQLAWAALSRADLCFSVSYLARFQSKPSGAAEACLRALLRWLLTRLHRVQIMPSPEGSPSVGPRSVVGFCDASWNVASVSGGVLMFEGCWIKVFSRKQECPALSSAEAELCAMTENSKELVSLGMLLESLLDGIPLTILGTPKCTTGTYHLVLRNDATAAISISSMEGLLRRVRHIELRAKYIQMLVKKKRLLLEHIPGLQNPSDGLIPENKPEVGEALSHGAASPGQTALPDPALPANPKSPTKPQEDKAEDSGDLGVQEPPEKKARKSLEEEMGKLMQRTREGYDLTAAALDKVQQHLDISRQNSKDIAQLAQEVHCEKVGAKCQLAQLQQVLSSFQHLEWQVGGTKAESHTSIKAIANKTLANVTASKEALKSIHMELREGNEKADSGYQRWLRHVGSGLYGDIVARE